MRGRPHAAPSAANIRNGAKGVARKFGTDLANGTAVPAAVSHAPALTARARSALGPRTTESDSLVSRFEGLLGGHTAPAVPILDIDAADRDQPNNVVEYIKDIYEHLRQFEVKYQPSANYMASQTDITDRMRAILVDWLIDVHLKFKLRQETLYLCFQIIDRFLEKQLVARSRLQLVGVTGLMLASKYEEIYPPEVGTPELADMHQKN